MGISDAISTEELKVKLLNLKELMPEESEFVYDFGAYFATRLNKRINPNGFNLEYQLTLYDLNRGVDGYTNQPVPHSLSGLPSIVYAAMGMNIIGIARAVCPSDFADEVEQIYAETHKR
jgi:hypothetical protein